MKRVAVFAAVLGLMAGNVHAESASSAAPVILAMSSTSHYAAQWPSVTTELSVTDVQLADKAEAEILEKAQARISSRLENQLEDQFTQALEYAMQ